MIDVETLKDGTTTINIAELTNGVYLIRATAGGEKAVAKFTKAAI